MSQELGVPVDQVAKAGGQAARPWWVRVCVGTAGAGQVSLCVDQQGCGWVWCVCVRVCPCAGMCARMDEFLYETVLRFVTS